MAVITNDSPVTIERLSQWKMEDAAAMNDWCEIEGCTNTAVYVAVMRIGSFQLCVEHFGELGTAIAARQEAEFQATGKAYL